MWAPPDAVSLQGELGLVCLFVRTAADFSEVQVLFHEGLLCLSHGGD